jgi:hypothetical protein
MSDWLSELRESEGFLGSLGTHPRGFQNIGIAADELSTSTDKQDSLRHDPRKPAEASSLGLIGCDVEGIGLIHPLVTCNSEAKSEKPLGTHPRKPTEAPRAFPVGPDFEKTHDGYPREPIEAAFNCWTLCLTDGRTMSITTAPASTINEVMARYPAAISAKPGHDQAKPDRPLSPQEERGLLAYLTSINESDPAITLSALKQCRDDALARRDWLTAARAFIGEPQTCSGCTYFSQLAGGFCGSPDRSHEPAHYGENHPLRALPGDRGISCQHWQNHNPSKENQS